MECTLCEHSKSAYDHQQQRIRIWVSGPIIVGAGPSGLATAACLQQHNVPSLILERESCLASLWQLRTYDRLKLHLPKHFCQLPLLHFPPNFPTYPSKHQFISYLLSYARRFNLQPRFRQCVKSASYDPVAGLWRVLTHHWRNPDTGVEYLSRWLVVATGENAEPVLPNLPGSDIFSGRVIHSGVYKTGEDFRRERVLVVGCGNSGMEVCLDLCDYDATPFMAVRSNVHVLPREMFGLSTFGVAMALLKWFPMKLVDQFLLMMAIRTIGDTEKYGLKRPELGPIELKNRTGKTPVLDIGALSKIKSGKIKIVPEVVTLTCKGAKFCDGREIEIDSVILATGYKSNVPSWLKDCDFFSEDGKLKSKFPNGWKGENGLYCVGFTGKGLLGAGDDAKNIALDIAEKWKNLPEHKPLIIYTRSQPA